MIWLLICSEQQQAVRRRKTAIFSRNRPFFFFQKLIDALGIVLMSAVVAIIIRK